MIYTTNPQLLLADSVIAVLCCSGFYVRDFEQGNVASNMCEFKNTIMSMVLDTAVVWVFMNIKNSFIGVWSQTMC